MGWNDQRVELLKKLWVDGLSASQIAAQLGGVTRNSVIGKVHRLGLSGRAKTPSTSVPKVRTPRKDSTIILTKRQRVHNDRAPHDALEMPPTDNAVIFTVPMGNKVSILELGDSTCRWPIGEVARPGFGYCGAQPKKGSSYCPYHTRAAHQPAADRRQQQTLRNSTATAVANVARALSSPALAATH